MGLKYFFSRIEEEFEMIDFAWSFFFFWKNQPLEVHGNLKRDLLSQNKLFMSSFILWVADD